MVSDYDRGRAERTVAAVRDRHPDDDRFTADRVDASDADAVAEAVLRAADDLSHDEDVQLALYCLYELSYGGFAGVDEDLEWDPELLRARRRVETAFEAELRAKVPVPARPDVRRDERGDLMAAIDIVDSPLAGTASVATREGMPVCLPWEGLREVCSLPAAQELPVPKNFPLIRVIRPASTP